MSDLNNVRNHFGGSGLGDADGDRDVDLGDLNVVRNQFGEETPPSGNAALSPTRAAAVHAFTSKPVERDLRALDLVFARKLATPEDLSPERQNAKRKR